MIQIIKYIKDRFAPRKKKQGGLNLFRERIAFRPNEYPELLKYKDAIRHAYWLHTEFNVSADIHDFKVNITASEREALRRLMLAIAQIEVSVKTFWAKTYDRMRKPEIAAVGMTFAESEVRHADAYAFLLEQLGLNEQFKEIEGVPAIRDRIDYLKDHLKGSMLQDEQEYALTVLLFAVFVEHVSLFGQFLAIMSFNKHRNLFKGISNIVEATSKEEDVHGRFGLALVDIIRKEDPSWLSAEMKQRIVKACLKAEKAEHKILDWIFESGELDFMPKDCIVNFMRDRFNKSLKALDIDPVFQVDADMLQQTRWFDEELLATKDNDNFNKRSTAYAKKTQSVTSNDLF